MTQESDPSLRCAESRAWEPAHNCRVGLTEPRRQARGSQGRPPAPGASYYITWSTEASPPTRPRSAHFPLGWIHSSSSDCAPRHLDTPPPPSPATFIITVRIISFKLLRKAQPHTIYEKRPRIFSAPARLRASSWTHLISPATALAAIASLSHSQNF